MSGQLVGEVLDAAEAGHLDDLSANAFAALIVIADRAHTDTRQGSVRADRIAVAIRRPNAPWCATTAGSRSTVERAIRELKSAGRISVVKRGFNNAHGKAHAPVYEVAPFPSPKLTETGASVPVTQADGNGGPFPSNGRPFPSNRGTVAVTQGDDLTLFLDGPIDGGSARGAESAPDESQPRDNDPPPNQSSNDNQPVSAAATAALPNWVRGPYGPRCLEHVDWDPATKGRVPNCPDCRDARSAAKAEDARNAADAVDAATAAAADRDAIRKAIDNCPDCDQIGRLDDLTDCPRHTNFRQFRVS